MVYLMLNSPKNHQSRLKRFYPNSCSIFDNTSADPFEISSCVLNLPMNFPKQFFKFKNPISILLQISQEMVIKVNRGKEFLFETSAKVTELSHKPPLLEFNIVGMQQDTQPEFNVSYKKKSTAAGVCNINVPLVLAYTGIYTVKIHATILDAKSRQIGKGEYGEIIIECI